MKTNRIIALVLAGVMAAGTLTGCGINKDATLATMGDTKVSMGILNFVFHYNQVYMDDNYLSYFGEGYWDSDLYSSGSTMIESTKENLLDTLHELYTLAEDDHMKEMGVELTADDTAAITEAATAFMNANSQEAIEEMGATQEIVEEMLTLYTIRVKMEAAMEATADTEVSDEEANCRAYTILQMATDSHYDTETASTVDYTETEVAAIEGNFAYISTQASADPSSFEAAAETFGYSTSSSTYAQDNTTLDDVVREALDALSEGQMSEVIETDTDIYLVRLDGETDADATETHRQEIISNRQSEAYETMLSDWQEDDGWTVSSRVLATLKFDNYLTSQTEAEEEVSESTEQ